MSVTMEIQDEKALLEKFGAEKRFNPPDSYSKKASFYGDGKYPPDWSHRRDAIWWLQDDHCARCGTQQNGRGHVHHVKPLADGGTNSLLNLVGLCVDCHALLHPSVSDLNGDWTKAPKYPWEHAKEEVAVIRRGYSNSGNGQTLEIERDFEKLAEESSPEQNYYASQSRAVYATNSAIARQFSSDSPSDSAEHDIETAETLNKLLLMRNRVPENKLYSSRKLEVNTSLSGILGWLSSFEPEIRVKPARTSEAEKPFGMVTEEVEREESADKEVLFSEDVTEATVVVDEGDGGFTTTDVEFETSQTQSLSLSISPPPLSLSTAGPYLLAGLKKFVFLLAVLLSLLLGPLVLGIIPAMVLYHTVPSLPAFINSGPGQLISAWILGLIVAYFLGR